MKELRSFDFGHRAIAYYCKSCEKPIVKKAYAPNQCEHCDSTDFWSEFDLGAPCNRHGEEENLSETEIEEQNARF